MQQKLQNEMDCVIKAAGENKSVMESWKWNENCDGNCMSNVISKGGSKLNAICNGGRNKNEMCDENMKGMKSVKGVKE